jgi:hypothetical protein
VRPFPSDIRISVGSCSLCCQIRLFSNDSTLDVHKSWAEDSRFTTSLLQFRRQKFARAWQYRVPHWHQFPQNTVWARTLSILLRFLEHNFLGLQVNVSTSNSPRSLCTDHTIVGRRLHKLQPGLEKVSLLRFLEHNFRFTSQRFLTSTVRGRLHGPYNSWVGCLHKLQPGLENVSGGNLSHVSGTYDEDSSCNDLLSSSVHSCNVVDHMHSATPRASCSIPDGFPMRHVELELPYSSHGPVILEVHHLSKPLLT